MAQAKHKKRFFDVEIPLIGKETHLLAYESKELDGKLIKYDLTRILRGKSVIVQLIVKTDGDKITSIPREIKLLPYYLKRMVRKGTDYVEDSFLAECKNAVVKIKPFLVTRRKVSRAVRKALRKKARDELIKYAKGKNANDIFEEILKNKIQKELSLNLKKIYPLSLCEIRILKVEKFAKDEENSDERKKSTKKKSEESGGESSKETPAQAE